MTSNRIKQAALWSLFVLAVASGAAACGDDSGDDSSALDEELCEHMQMGPFEPLTAATSTSATVPNATIEHARMDITLPASGPGYLLFEAQDAGEYVFALNDDIGFQALDASDPSTPLTLETKIGSELCSEVVVQHFLDLSVGQVYLQLGPGTSVGLVFEHAAEHEHSHE